MSSQQRAPTIAELRQKIAERMKHVKHKIITLSGKGGTGKTLVTAELAAALAKLGKRVGVLDADIHGPCIPKIFGVERGTMMVGPQGIEPAEGPLGIKIASIELMLPEAGTPVIWRGPLKTRFIAEILSYVNWGELDFLLVDLPPGTGDEPLSVAQLIPNLDGAIIVTMPSMLSEHVVRKSIKFCEHVGVRILGLIENMAYFICPNCGQRHYIFGSPDVGRRLAEEFGIRFLGEIPLDPRIRECHDAGRPFVLAYPDSEAAGKLMDVAQKLLAILGE